MSLNRLLARWRAEPGVAGNMVEWRELPARPARLWPFPPNLHPALAAALRRRGIEALYTHQAAAWEQLGLGRHVAAVAGTASGKTLCYNLSILDRALRDPQARALYLFPTKALAQDQLAGLRGLLDSLDAAPPTAAIYDGDTPTRSRRLIRQAARLLLTNPDMLHLGILPHHTDWAEFFAHLAFVVIDEAHTYRGVFGSHVANALRRLQRVARFYGGAPQYILTTATLANPAEFTARLIGAPVTVIDDDGAPRGPKHFLIYNPPLVDRRTGLRHSAITESVRLAQDLLAYDVQTILFGRSRRTVEMLLTYLREGAAPLPPLSSGERGSAPGVPLEGVGGNGLHSSPFPPTEFFPPLPSGERGPGGEGRAIRGYRSGYLPAERRAIEQGLREGVVRAVAATNALELGIDIGGLGAAVLVGYPGTVAAAWQQAGRAGRGAAASLAVLVATADPLDQFLAAHPDYFFGRSPEHALINPDNLLILLDHLRCAAFELPFQAGDGFGSLPPDQTAEFLDFLTQQGSLHRSGGKYFWVADAYPAQAISLRSASADTIALQTEDENGQPRTIGSVDRASALWLAHPQAIYLHEAQSYFVESLDLEQKIARLRPNLSDYYTRPTSQTTVQIVEQFAAAGEAGAQRAHGELLITRQVVGFQKVRWHTHEVLGIEPLDLPATELLTTGYWLALEPATVSRLQEAGLWRNAPNDYGPGWPKLREQVRSRDGYRCQVCGAAENERQHDVHHKVPFRLFSDRSAANQPDNLITLCHNCHRQVESAVRVRSGLAGLAYTLGHLAPFFLMCDAGDLGVHSDPQAAFANSNPAVALYDQAPGGIGLSQRLYDLHANLLAQARTLIAACPCADGCPSCVGPGGGGLPPGAPALPAEASYGGKQETLAILDLLI